MSGKEILVDTNIILYLLRGSVELEEYLQGKDVFISFVTELELLGYKSLTKEHESQIISILEDCLIIQMNDAIKEKYLELTRKYSFKLPDALIAATALVLDIPIITADKGFQKINELKLVFYNQSAKLGDTKAGTE